MVGKTVSDKGFVSTTVKETSGFGSNLALTIQAPKGTAAAYVEHASQFQSEKELILNAGTKFKVVQVDPPAPPAHPRAHAILEVVP